MSSDERPRAAARVLARIRGFFALPGTPQALWLLAGIVVLAALFPQFFDEVRLRGFDLEQRMVHRPAGDQRVVIVAIDEASLKSRYGQWPWPRDVVAQLIEKIGSGLPSALGVDIIFSEPDRFSPASIARAVPGLPPDAAAMLRAMPSNDDRLGAAVKTAPTILGMGVTSETDASAPRLGGPRILSAGADPVPFLPKFVALVRSRPEIVANETGHAALVGDPDRDGIVRRVPLIVDVGGNLIAGLALETFREIYDARRVVVHATDHGIEGVQVGDKLLPTDGNGRAYPYFAPAGSTQILSASAVLDPSYDPAWFRGRAVMLGITGLGLVDLKETPVGLMQGIEVQAQLVLSMLENELLRRPLWMARLENSLIVVAALVVLVFPYRRPLRAAAALVAIIVLCLGGEFASFRFGHLLADGIFPALSSLLTFGVMLSANLRATEDARKLLASELEREREAKARIEGELNAARAIQMGLLPRPLPRVPETRAVEVHPLIETARTVGGDLYDFVMIDPTHLFFAIADVSGKGVDAALFMAMTKMVLGGSTLQHGEAVDRVLIDANSKITVTAEQTSAEGGRPMFVTVFAAVLDLASGRITFASAGHDSPYLLRAGGTPQRLETAGGPPLGTIDDFPFPVDSQRLEPGDVILLYTDGVTEAKDMAGGFYGTARLDALLTASVETGARAAVELVREDVRQFVGEAEQADDITLLGVRWLGPDGALTAP